MHSILVVDDDAQLRQSFERLLAGEGYGVATAPTGEAGLEAVRSQTPDLVIMDVRMPGLGGLETFKAMREIEPRLQVIIMTAYSTTETAIEATKLGAFDYVLKPFEIPDILSLIEKALEASRFMRNRVEMDAGPSTASPDAMIGRSAAMQEVYKAIGRAAPTDATVLVRGESGTGKELVARAVYQHSLRAHNPFVVINCVAIPDTLLESELFGYERGSFTGAAARKTGKIEQANGGTVFLDEIGDMPFNIQGKILRLLEERSIERLGGHGPIRVDVRIVAATNRDLEAALAEGRFREDLYYRLKVVTIELPPLRERRGDTALLCDFFLDRFSRDMGIDNPGLTGEAVVLVESLPWPGNVRELANTLQKALIFNLGLPIGSEDISKATGGNGAGAGSLLDGPDELLKQWVRRVLAAGPRDDLFSRCTECLSQSLISEALQYTGGNRSRAARLLGLSRPTLLAKMKKHDAAGDGEA